MSIAQLTGTISGTRVFGLFLRTNLVGVGCWMMGEAIQKRALAEGLPYQTLISSLLPKYASGRLREV